MLQALISLSDQDIVVVTTAVREWCKKHRCIIDSVEGHRALTLAIDLVQSKGADENLLALLTHRLGPQPQPV